MNINQINKDFKELYSNIDIKKITAISFTKENEKSRIINIFKLGYWSLVPFAFGTHNNYAIKLNPKEKIIKSPIIYINNSDGILFSPNLKNFLNFQLLNYLTSQSLLENIILKNWNEFKEKSSLFLEYTNGEDTLSFLNDYIHSSKIVEYLKNPDLGYSKIYLDFWNHYNKSEKQKIYSKNILSMADDTGYLPKFENIDFGIWNNRMFNSLAHRAYSRLDLNFDKSKEYYWKYITQQHGFDSLEQDFGIVPNSSSATSRAIGNIIDKFNPELNTITSKEILNHPLYDAIQDLRIKRSGYMGEKHVEAAKILDLEHNDPYAAWDALVTASYWAGLNRSKAIEPIWEAAIFLSEKEGWNEINKVLIQQYEYYNTYKNKV